MHQVADMNGRVMSHTLTSESHVNDMKNMGEDTETRLHLSWGARGCVISHV